MKQKIKGALHSILYTPVYQLRVLWNQRSEKKVFLFLSSVSKTSSHRFVLFLSEQPRMQVPFSFIEAYPRRDDKKRE